MLIGLCAKASIVYWKWYSSAIAWLYENLVYSLYTHNLEVDTEHGEWVSSNNRYVKLWWIQCSLLGCRAPHTFNTVFVFLHWCVLVRIPHTCIKYYIVGRHQHHLVLHQYEWACVVWSPNANTRRNHFTGFVPLLLVSGCKETKQKEPFSLAAHHQPVKCGYILAEHKHTHTHSHSAKNATSFRKSTNLSTSKNWTIKMEWIGKKKRTSQWTNLTCIHEFSKDETESISFLNS